MPEIDLLPKDYSSERKKPREPIFGPGLPDAICYLIGFFAVVTVIYLFKN